MITLAQMERPVVAIMQPTFLPWQGYFALAAAADVFVFLDDAQFSRQSFHHRNRVFSKPDQVQWITLPVGHAGRPEALNEVRPLLDPRFLRKTRSLLAQSYGRTPFFDEIFPFVSDWLADDSASSLADRNISFIQWVAALMGLKTEFKRSSALQCDGQRSQRLLNILSATGAASYISPRGSYDYMRDEGLFAAREASTFFQSFQPQSYPQVQSRDFVPYLSMLDALFQVGPTGARALGVDSAQMFQTWQERAAMPQASDEPQAADFDVPAVELSR
jgi:hypothetical protein